MWPMTFVEKWGGGRQGLSGAELLALSVIYPKSRSQAGSLLSPHITCESKMEGSKLNVLLIILVSLSNRQYLPEWAPQRALQYLLVKMGPFLSSTKMFYMPGSTVRLTKEAGAISVSSVLKASLWRFFYNRSGFHILYCWLWALIVNTAIILENIK